VEPDALSSAGSMFVFDDRRDHAASFRKRFTAKGLTDR